MSNQGGYAVVDVDEDVAGDIGGQSGGNGLEFKKTYVLAFLGDDNSRSQASGSGQSSGREPPAVPYSPFGLAYYQGYFDMDTKDVLTRVAMAMIPREGFITNVCEERVDLYGSFWTLTTLIFTLYIFSSLSTSLTAYSAGEPTTQDLTLLSVCVTLIYSYGLGFPALLWAATKWLGVGSWSMAEALSIYGYAHAVYIPISALCLIPVPIFRWVLVGAGAASSGYFLVRNIYPVLASSENKATRFLIIAVVVPHGAIALTLKVLFFSYSVGGVSLGPSDPIDVGVGEGNPV